MITSQNLDFAYPELLTSVFFYIAVAKVVQVLVSLSFSIDVAKVVQVLILLSFSVCIANVVQLLILSCLNFLLTGKKSLVVTATSISHPSLSISV